LIKNIAHDHDPGHGTAFHLVHYVLAAIALGLDVGVIAIGWRGWRASRVVNGEDTPAPSRVDQAKL
jgi:hypothetical protein